MKTSLYSDDAIVFQTTGNIIPSGMTTGFLKVSESVNVRFARFEPLAKPFKGTILLLHGRNEFIEKYFETVDNFQKRGFGVLTFDWRGQGGSSRLLQDPTKGHVENFDHYLEDLDKIVTEIALPDCKPPYFILAHSMGGLVALLAAPALQNRISRMVLSSPLLALNNLPVKQSLLQKILGVATFFGLGRHTVMGRKKQQRLQEFEHNNLTSDKTRFDRNNMIVAQRRELGLGPPTIAWVFAACRTMARVNSQDYSDAISIPTLLVAGGADVVVSPSAVEHFGRRMRSGSYLVIDGAKHEVMQERDSYQDQFYAAFDAFIPGTDQNG